MSEFTEVLEKKCPRCGGASASKGNPSGRCSACLKKLAAAKKKPGSSQRAQTKADDALRRQKGKNGTASKKSSGLGSRKSIVKQIQTAEKKTGEKLSPDRKDNSKGYAASNTRAVPEKLNRGRHHVDPKKLRAWKKRLKKNDITVDELYTLMKAKFQDDAQLSDLIKSLSPQGLSDFIELFDRDQESEDPKSDGLEKGAMRRLAPKPVNPIKNEDDFFPRSASTLEHNPRTNDPSEEKRTQLAAVKYFNGQPDAKSHFQTRTNSATGKPELHLKLHRGMNYDEAASEENYGPDWKDSLFEVKDGKVGHKGEGWWTNEDAAKTYGDLHSAWVPVSHIQTIGSRLPGQSNNSGSNKQMRELASHHAAPDHMHFTVKPGMYDYANPVKPQEAPKIEPEET